jgi:uncharacterized protein (DUF1697 family)
VHRTSADSARTFRDSALTADSASGGFVRQILPLPVTPAVGQTLQVESKSSRKLSIRSLKRTNTMKYIVLLRKINAGKENRIDMKSLARLFELPGYDSVATYINSGNVIFNSQKGMSILEQEIDEKLFEHFEHRIQFILKSHDEIKTIADSIPKAWQNNSDQRTDVAYLFAEIDRPNTISELPMKIDFIEIRYVRGAIIWHLKREDLNKSQLSKLISHRHYQYMTIRNVNTARYLASMA